MAKKKKDMSSGTIISICGLTILLMIPVILSFFMKETDAIVIYDNSRAMSCRKVENHIGNTAECIVGFPGRPSSTRIFLLDNISAIYYKENHHKEYMYLRSILSDVVGRRMPKELLDNINKLE